MNNKEVIKKLNSLNKDKVVVLCDPDGKGWTNIGKIVEDGSDIKIIMDGGNGPFSSDN